MSTLTVQGEDRRCREPVMTHDDSLVSSLEILSCELDDAIQTMKVSIKFRLAVAPCGLRCGNAR